jgi:hypothetical protein
MVSHSTRMAVFLVALASITATVLLWPVPSEDEEPDPFYATFLMSEAVVNSTDPSRLDAAIWVAVAGGEPKPRWAEVDVVARDAGTCRTLAPPVLEVDDLDANGRMTRGDVVHLNGLEGSLWGADVAFVRLGIIIGSVRISNATTT